MMRAALFVCLVAACASGGVNGSDSKMDAAVHRDGQSVAPDGAHLPDASTTKHDAAPTPDASIDAGGGDGAICSMNSQCAVSGECCVTLGGPQGFCAPGTPVGNQCVPQ